MVQTAPGTRHALSAEVARQCTERYGMEEVDDSVAAAIASYWQGPSGHGLTFHMLASGQEVNTEALLDAIAHERPHARAQGGTSTLELDMLATWALNHGQEVVG